jgi:thioredoxin-like negative regulator of GroEL
MCRFAAKIVGRLLFPSALFLCVGTAAVAQTAIPAGEVQWRSDYNSARREAADKNRPLVVDFGTANCYWCKRLDAETFRDPTIARLMNERFIALRIDADKEVTLAQMLRIQNYPTIVIAAPDGRILVTREGYMEAAPFLEQLQRALATISNPEWMTHDYQEAVKAIEGTDYSRAIGLLRSVIEDGKERPVQIKAGQLLKDLEQQAAGRLVRAKQYNDKGQTTEAMDTLTELIRAFSGTQAAAEAGQMLTSLGTKSEIKAKQRTQRAQELLAQAREDYSSGQYLCCMDRCEVLTSSYGDLPEGEEAKILESEIKSNPVWMQTACESLSDRLGLLYLSLADTWLKKGQPQQAALCLEKVVKSFPSSQHAEAAQRRLAQIQGRPTQQTNFKKP